MKVEITFNVSGYVRQVVEITDPTMTADKLQTLLDQGEIVTTIQENGTIEFAADGQAVGQVIYVEPDLDYDEFEVENVVEAH